MMKIVSHRPPRHMDDYIAICLLKNLYPQAQIEYTHPQEVPKEYLEDKNVVLVDVGMRYEPEKSNYDHHQDSNLSCSAILVLKHFTDLPLDAPFLKAIDLTDRFGVNKALQEGLIRKDKEVDFKRKVILFTEITDAVASIVHNTVKILAKGKANYETFINFLYGMLSHLPEFRQAKEKLESYEERLEKVQVVEVDGLRVGYSLQTLAPFHYEAFNRFKLDMLVERNSMKEEHTSLIINTSSENKDKAYALRESLIEDMPVVFRHATGFIVVVDVPVEEFERRWEK
ncbi:MAG: MYG1 family protein [Aquificaceae bacterium]